MTLFSLLFRIVISLRGYRRIETDPNMVILTNQYVSTLGDFGRLFRENLVPQLQVRHPNKSHARGGRLGNATREKAIPWFPRII